MKVKTTENSGELREKLVHLGWLSPDGVPRTWDYWHTQLVNRKAWQ